MICRNPIFEPKGVEQRLLILCLPTHHHRISLSNKESESCQSVSHDEFFNSIRQKKTLRFLSYRTSFVEGEMLRARPTTTPAT
jgi:hypothetical protein